MIRLATITGAAIGTITGRALARAIRKPAPVVVPVLPPAYRSYKDALPYRPGFPLAHARVPGQVVGVGRG